MTLAFSRLSSIRRIFIFLTASRLMLLRLICTVNHSISMSSVYFTTVVHSSKLMTSRARLLLSLAQNTSFRGELVKEKLNDAP